MIMPGDPAPPSQGVKDPTQLPRIANIAGVASETGLLLTLALAQFQGGLVGWISVPSGR